MRTGSFVALGLAALVAGAAMAEWQRPSDFTRSFLFAEAANAASSGAPEYDDPAVAACEYKWTRGKPPALNAYRRISALVSGSTVSLTYERSVLNTRPRQEVIECRFEANIDRELVFVSEATDVEKTCIDRARRWESIAADLKKTGRSTEEFREEMVRCKAILKSGLDREAKLLTEVTLPLMMAGIYPIKPGDTQLTAPWDKEKFASECSRAVAGLEGLGLTDGEEAGFRATLRGCVRSGLVSQDEAAPLLEP